MRNRTSQGRVSPHRKASQLITKTHFSDLAELMVAASQAPRQRTHRNLHPSLDSNVQRLFIATQPDTYMRPHRHPQAHKWEMLMLVQGELDLLIFDDAGRLIERVEMSPSSTRVVEIPPGTWHGYVCRSPQTLALEIKEGAYLPTEPEDFAPWSPAEGSPEAPAYLQKMRTAQVAS